MAASVTMLDVTGLGVHRGKRSIVSGVTFAADAGDVTAIMGPSGAGKTTVVRSIAGLEPIAEGTIAIQGLRLTAGGLPRGRVRRELHHRVGMVFQFHHLFTHLTALDNVSLALVHVGRQERTAADERSRALLDQLGVGERAGAMPGELSGGEAQRVAIARALAMDPPVLLMDEPTASLDPARREDLAAIVRRMAGDGRTIVMATHDIDFARACARRVIVMESGCITRAGEAAKLLA
jgi:ABC-type polar amino acid transport system ATPase subunit